MDYLLDKPQQEKAPRYGFRPANVSVPLAPPIDTVHGVNPKAPKTTLEMPSVPVMGAIIKLWHQNKKPANIILMLDRSGGMRGEKIRHARSSALQLLEILKDVDYFSLLSFNHRLKWVAENVPVGGNVNGCKGKSKYQFAGGTALYDAIEQAYTVIKNNPQPDKISAIVVLSDGKDNSSHLSLQDLLNKIQFDSEKLPVRIFTISYFEPTEKKLLREIAKVT